MARATLDLYSEQKPSPFNSSDADTTYYRELEYENAEIFLTQKKKTSQNLKQGKDSRFPLKRFATVGENHSKLHEEQTGENTAIQSFTKGLFNLFAKKK